jgi:hypothetical protein
MLREHKLYLAGHTQFPINLPRPYNCMDGLFEILQDHKEHIVHYPFKYRHWIWNRSWVLIAQRDSITRILNGVPHTLHDISQIEALRSRKQQLNLDIKKSL